MSTRTYSLPDKIENGLYRSLNCTGGVVANVVQPTVVEVNRGFYSGARTPHYHQRLKSGGLLPLNAYTRQDYHGKRDLGESKLRQLCANGNYMTSDNSGNGISTPFLLWNGQSIVLPKTVDPWAGINTDALLIAAMADCAPSLDALTSAMEARQTIKMVINARSDAKRLIRAALRGGKHTVKAASEAWLAWRYGWDTLRRDVENVYDLLQNPYQRVIVDGRSGESSNDTDETQTKWNTALAWTRDYTIKYDMSVRANVIVVWRGKTLNVLADPLTTAWELVPFSFVADWFVNVGDVLAAWKVRSLAKEIYASLGSKLTVTVSGKTTAYGLPPWTGLCNSNSSEELRVLQRIPASIPSLVPSINVQLTSKRLLDAAALCAVRIF